MVERFGPVPKRRAPSEGPIAHTTAIFCDHVIAETAPDVAVVWFSEPDHTFHYSGLDTPHARSVLAALDQSFAEIVAALDEYCTVLLAYDHGHLTIDHEVDVRAQLIAKGIPAPDWRRPPIEAARPLSKAGQWRTCSRDPGTDPAP